MAFFGCDGPAGRDSSGIDGSVGVGRFGAAMEPRLLLLGEEENLADILESQELRLVGVLDVGDLEKEPDVLFSFSLLDMLRPRPGRVGIACG